MTLREITVPIIFFVQALKTSELDLLEALQAVRDALEAEV